MSQLLTGQDVWPRLQNLTKTRTGRAWCAIAYIGVNADSWLELRAGDTLVCDASDGAVRLGMTSAAQLRRWVEAGVAVYSRAGMHAKIGALPRWAFVGSANASDSSAMTREEAVLLTTDAGTREQVRDYVKDLLSRCRVVDGTELARLDLIPVRSLPWPKMEPRFRPPIADGARLHLWEWDEVKWSPEEERRAADGQKDLAALHPGSDRVEVTVMPDSWKNELPVVGDFLCYRGDGGWTLPPAKVELVKPRRGRARAAVFYLVRADLRSMRTGKVEEAIAGVDHQWNVPSRLSPRATRAVSALDWAKPSRAKP